VATGEHWLAKQAIDLQLVDQLTTSDDYLLRACSQADIYHVKYAGPKLNFKEKLGLYLYQGQHNTIF
jgi:serine protease SohB